jgi:hypothetical protein
MDVVMARQTRLALALLGATALACASSEESSFSGGPGLSAGNGNSATDASSTSEANTSDASDATASGSNSNSNSGTTTMPGTSDPGTSDPTTTDPTTGTDTDDPTTGTTGLDCDDGLGNLCGNPYDLGSIAEGETVMSQTSTIITPGVADWFQVAFPAINRPGGGTPSISFLQNDDDAFRFDVFTGMPCGGEAASCGEGGDENSQATNLDEYTYTDDQPDCCSPPDDSMVPWPGQLYIRVYRVDDGQTCSAYQLTLSR